MAGAFDDLDPLFGECRSASYIKPEEMDPKDLSITILDETAAQHLIEILDVATRNPWVFAGQRQITYLWCVDEQGLIRIALEESFEVGDPTKRFARARNIDYPVQNYRHLGHPILVDGGRARIAGELYLDQGESLHWMLTNKSGRYGFGREPQHLDNVALAFSRLGVPIKVRYLA